ncbi:MAG: mechanosensitive ion channel family protein [Tannerella sp.]|jgi:hypothetical protein|nr:mechanosensitive ion channel family protein [Tannerella sp.]
MKLNTYKILHFSHLTGVFLQEIVKHIQLLPWSKSPVFQGVSVFIGLLISFGSTGVISNLVSGLVIIYMRPFIQDDRIRIGDTYGDVVEKTPFVIRNPIK